MTEKLISEQAQAYLNDDPTSAGCLELFKHEFGDSFQARAENIDEILSGLEAVRDPAS
jgi:hypothetical protein